MKHCINCNIDIQEDANYCPLCGRYLLDEKEDINNGYLKHYCPSCHKEIININDKFCSNCGYDLNKKDNLNNVSKNVNESTIKLSKLERAKKSSEFLDFVKTYETKLKISHLLSFFESILIMGLYVAIIFVPIGSNSENNFNIYTVLLDFFSSKTYGYLNYFALVIIVVGVIGLLFSIPSFFITLVDLSSKTSGNVKDYLKIIDKNYLKNNSRSYVYRNNLYLHYVVQLLLVGAFIVGLIILPLFDDTLTYKLNIFSYIILGSIQLVLVLDIISKCILHSVKRKYLSSLDEEN